MRKNLIVIIGIVAVLAAAGGAVWYSRQQAKNQQVQGKILSDKDRRLTPDQKKIYLDRIKKAEDDLRSLKVADPKYQVMLVNDNIYLAEQYFGLGKLGKAREYYQKVLQADISNESALVGLATVYSDAGDFKDARSAMETALKNNPKNYNLWLQYIDVRRDLGAGSQDISQLYEQALNETNRYVDIITRDAQFQERQGNVAQAIALWQEAAKKNPEGAQMYQQEISRLQKLKK